MYFSDEQDAMLLAIKFLRPEIVIFESIILLGVALWSIRSPRRRLEIYYRRHSTGVRCSFTGH